MVTKAEKAAAAAKDSVDPEKVSKTAAEAGADAVAEFDWAVNSVKLNRAKAHVSQTPETKGLKGKALEAAVKARYVEIGGLLAGEKPVRVGKGGKTKNMADDDGSDDK